MLKLLPLFAVTASLAFATASGPATPPPSGGNQSGSGPANRQDPPELSFYNDGVKLLFKKEWASAEKQFNAAVAINGQMPEAHNNLAYVLRKQSEQNYGKSLEHYNRAIELKPNMPEPLMYRGALHFFMGHPELAKADHAALLNLKTRKARELALHLQKILDTGREEEPEQFYGVSKKK